ncbi:MAG: DUF4864 domain-containing protein [bacterium]|nr:DUF4864 domain-containing protein [bacterium]
MLTLIHPPLHPVPHPTYSPDEVIRIQLRALQHNDHPGSNSGIAVAFGFASPANRVVTGPLMRFMFLVHDTLYAPLLNFQCVDYAPIVVDGNFAQQVVRVVGQHGESAAYVFGLSRQENDPFSGCWMTDSVLRIE